MANGSGRALFESIISGIVAVEPEIETASKVVGTTDGNRRVIDLPVAYLRRF